MKIYQINSKTKTLEQTTTKHLKTIKKQRHIRDMSFLQINEIMLGLKA